MPDFPVQLTNPPPIALSTLSLWPELGRAYGGGLWGSRAWPASGRGIFMPFVLDEPAMAYKGSVVQGNAAGGVNVDFGIYDLDGNRIVSTGNITQTAGITVFDFADTVLAPGYYFMAYACTSGDHLASNAATVVLMEKGIREITSGALPLPATATLAPLTSAYLPFMTLHFNSNV